ncbi:hypothetical protein OG21DRAFT_1511699 [Imleria badia]|nr:hypothetical protein OG21DRAFT_1511699 [Imleria badia]
MGHVLTYHHHGCVLSVAPTLIIYNTPSTTSGPSTSDAPPTQHTRPLAPQSRGQSPTVPSPACPRHIFTSAATTDAHTVVRPHVHMNAQSDDALGPTCDQLRRERPRHSIYTDTLVFGGSRSGVSRLHATMLDVMIGTCGFGGWVPEAAAADFIRSIYDV